MKKLYFLFVIICFMLTSAAVPLNAEIRVEGRGSVWARGNGSVEISGNSALELTGNGILRINEAASCDLAEATGERLVTNTGGILYINFEGRVKVSGENISVTFNGANIILNARGTGVVTLKGTGLYAMGLFIGYWHPSEKTVITFTAPAEQ